MCGTMKSDVETVFSTINEGLPNVEVSQDNCVGIGMENTSVNLSINNSSMN